MLYDFAVNDLDLRYGRVNYSNLETGLRSWAHYNDISLKIDDDLQEQNGKWMVCRHGMDNNGLQSIVTW